MDVNLIEYPNLIKTGVIDKRFQYQVRDNGGYCDDHYFKIFVYDAKLSKMNDTMTTIRFTNAGVDDHIDLIRQYAKSLKSL